MASSAPGEAVPEPPSQIATTLRSGRVTLQDIAKATNVSRMTVSLALRNQSSVSLAVRERIKSVAAALAYKPDPMLSALQRYRHTRTSKPLRSALGWLDFWPEAKRLREVPLFHAHWTGAVAGAADMGFQIDEFACVRQDITPKRLRNILLARGIRGVLLAPQRPPIPREAFDFDWSGFAVIRIGRTVPHPLAHVVTHSQAHDALMAVRHMRERGYARIGFISSRTINAFGLFDAGFLKAQMDMPKHDRLPLLILEDWPRPTPETLEMIDVWMKKNRPEAILTTEGPMKSLLEAAGHRVPADVALATTSVSNSEADAGIFENPEEVGRTAVNNLVSLLQRGEVGLPDFEQEILVRGKWRDGSTLPRRV